MTYRILALVTALVLGACSSTEREAATDDGPALDLEGSRALENWTFASGTWEAVADQAAPNAKQALAQVGSDGSRPFNVALLDGSHFEDFDLSVSFLAVAGEIDQGGGPLWRAQDADNYYVARYNPLEDNYRVYSVKEGHRKELSSADIDATPGWHTLRVNMTGDLIHCFYDGELALEVHDTTFTAAGQLGLWTKADAQTRFHDLNVR